MTYTNWKLKENEIRLANAAQNNKSISGMCRELNLAPRGSNISTLRYHIVRLNIDVSHHTGKAWNKENYSFPKNSHNIKTIRARLLREGGNKCSSCNLTEWMGKDIPLELDHIDGNSKNNSEDNLRILCCNCHAQTPTFRNKKRTLVDKN